ncbi:MAG: hypothetical protein HeimC3_06340 [Candidatus Heimdallarchaeota archaeon LC_3]|nr:MAG: hypothetical protein HeimC3_06340 [Candidatus Heimdallarchaeota archaeon LC_3]
MNSRLSLRFKIIILGEGGVGKTTLSKSFEQNTLFQTTSQTIGVEIHIKHLQFDNFPCTVQLWDLGGQEHFKKMGIYPQLCQGAHGALICFDLSDLDTFNKLNQWVEFLPVKTPFILIGTKADLEKSDNFLEKEIIEWKLSNNCDNYLRTRFDDYKTIKNAFTALISKIIQKNSQEINNLENTNLSGFTSFQSLNGKPSDLYQESDSRREINNKKETGTILIR